MVAAVNRATHIQGAAGIAGGPLRVSPHPQTNFAIWCLKSACCAYLQICDEKKFSNA